MDIFKKIGSLGVVPVLGLKNPDTAIQVGQALQKGGISIIEVTLRNKGALECIREIKKAFPKMLVGAGTVLTYEQVDDAIAAEVDFVVAPGMNPKIVAYSIDRGISMIPGCSTASEIEQGLELGINVFKFFPSETLGGLSTIKQLSGPYGDVRFMCTGGINLSNIEQYLAYDKVLAVGGSFMAPADMINAQNWDKITELCRNSIEKSLGFSLAHIGINGKDKNEGLILARWFADRFGLPVKEGSKSNFVGTAVECCNMVFPGQNGHIGFFTHSAERAEAYFNRNGIPLRDEFRNVDSEGKLIAVYLKEEIAGFAVHVVKR